MTTLVHHPTGTRTQDNFQAAADGDEARSP